MIINQNLLCRCYVERSVSGISGCEGVINTHQTIKLSDYYGGGGYYWIGLFFGVHTNYNGCGGQANYNYELYGRVGDGYHRYYPYEMLTKPLIY